MRRSTRNAPRTCAGSAATAATPSNVVGSGAASPAQAAAASADARRAPATTTSEGRRSTAATTRPAMTTARGTGTASRAPAHTAAASMKTEKSDTSSSVQRVVAWFRNATPRQWLKRVLFAGAGFVLFFVAMFSLDAATMTLPDDPPRVQTSVVLDAEGNTIAELFKDQNRVDVPLRKVSPIMRKAVIAAEDRHFYEHSGIDPIGVTRAIVHDLRGGRLQGGSTITQQLVKNTYLTSKRSFVRKFKEAVLAVKVEQQFSKREILERYLNTVY